MDIAQQKLQDKQVKAEKKAYLKPTVTTEPLCSDMALCACDASASKLDWECEMLYGTIGPS